MGEHSYTEEKTRSHGLRLQLASLKEEFANKERSYVEEKNRSNDLSLQLAGLKLDFANKEHSYIEEKNRSQDLSLQIAGLHRVLAATKDHEAKLGHQLTSVEGQLRVTKKELMNETKVLAKAEQQHTEPNPQCVQ